MNGSSKLRFESFSNKLKSFGFEKTSKMNEYLDLKDFKDTSIKQNKNFTINNSENFDSNLTYTEPNFSYKMNKKDPLEELNKKFSDLKSINNNQVNDSISKLETKISSIEKDMGNKFSYVDSKFNLLKDKISNFIKEHELNEKEVSSIEKKAQKSYENLENNIEIHITDNSNVLSNFIEEINFDLSRKINMNEESEKAEFLKRSNIINEVKIFVDDQIPQIKNYLDEEIIRKHEFFNELSNEVNDEFTKINESLNELKTKNEESRNIYNDTLVDIRKKVKDQLNNEQSKRKDFEENIFSILEDTCNKLVEANYDY